MSVFLVSEKLTFDAGMCDLQPTMNYFFVEPDINHAYAVFHYSTEKLK